MSITRTAMLAVLALGLVGTTVSTASAAKDPSTGYAAVASDRSSSLVTIKFVISLSYQGQSEEIEREAGGIIIDGKAGLILASNFEMGGGMGTPKDIKVMIGDDTEGVAAKVIGRDSELELSWLRIEKPSEKGYAAVDPAKGVVPKVGDKLVGLDRMGKYFDRTTVLFETMVGGITKKPRPLYIPSGGAVGWVGLPMFSAGGEFVGVTVVQRTGGEEETDMRSAGRVTSFDRGLKVLPASEIVTATQRALEAEKSGKGMGLEEPKKEEPKDEGMGEKKDPAAAPAPSDKPAEAPKQ